MRPEDRRLASRGLACLMMPNGDPRDGLFHRTSIRIMDLLLAYQYHCFD